ncbi:phosphate signaling complex protein PhoU [bacterium]|jgi:phosphate transport system protein|nr:phosphate signaling complex protein PhoU [bacterium]
MSIHLARALEKLKQGILSVAGQVEIRVHDAVRSVQQRDRSLARTVVESDNDIDQQEVDVEEECLEVLALHQPVADQLRFVVAILKINNDLERIADLAVNIAQRAISLSELPMVEIPFDLEGIFLQANDMLKRSIDAMVQMDSPGARQVRGLDDSVDLMTAHAFQAVEDGIRANIGSLSQLIQYLSCARHLERIADLATNIAEDVIYLVDGEIVRHKPDSH